EPRGVPTDFAARIVDEAFKILTVERSRQRASGIFLMRIGFALMPQNGAKTFGTETFQACGKISKNSATSFPLARADHDDISCERGRVGKLDAGWEPFAEAGGADSLSHNTDRNLKPHCKSVAKDGHETPMVSVRSRFGIASEPPGCTIESGHE